MQAKADAKSGLVWSGDLLFRENHDHRYRLASSKSSWGQDDNVAAVTAAVAAVAAVTTVSSWSARLVIL